MTAGGVQRQGDQRAGRTPPDPQRILSDGTGNRFQDGRGDDLPQPAENVQESAPVFFPAQERLVRARQVLQLPGAKRLAEGNPKGRGLDGSAGPLDNRQPGGGPAPARALFAGHSCGKANSGGCPRIGPEPYSGAECRPTARSWPSSCTERPGGVDGKQDDWASTSHLATPGNLDRLDD